MVLRSYKHPRARFQRMIWRSVYRSPMIFSALVAEQSYGTEDKEMNLVSINRRKFLGQYCEAQNTEKFPEGLLWSGLLLSGILLTIYCLAGGMLTFITFVCVLILGSGLGVALSRYVPYSILSCASGISLIPSNKQPMPKAAYNRRHRPPAFASRR